MEKERNSERTLVWAAVIILGAKILGIDVGQLLGQTKDVADQMNSMGISPEVALGAAVGVYNWTRGKKKEAEILLKSAMKGEPK